MSKQYWADACTMNCVWLFQRAEYSNAAEVSNKYEYDQEEERWTDPEEPEREIDLQELLDANFAFKHWHTSRVFLTRVEAIDYGFSRHYDHGKYGEDWRLYGVPACGEMPELLSKGGVNQAYMDEKIPQADKAVQEWQEKLK